MPAHDSYAISQLYANGKRLYKRFKFDESESINFDEILGMSIGVPPFPSALRKHTDSADLPR